MSHLCLHVCSSKGTCIDVSCIEPWLRDFLAYRMLICYTFVHKHVQCCGCTLTVYLIPSLFNLYFHGIKWTCHTHAHCSNPKYNYIPWIMYTAYALLCSVVIFLQLILSHILQIYFTCNCMITPLPLMQPSGIWINIWDASSKKYIFQG